MQSTWYLSLVLVGKKVSGSLSRAKVKRECMSAMQMSVLSVYFSCRLDTGTVLVQYIVDSSLL
jgi:hypothetical protein